MLPPIRRPQQAIRPPIRRQEPAQFLKRGGRKARLPDTTRRIFRLQVNDFPYHESPMRAKLWIESYAADRGPYGYSINTVRMEQSALTRELIIIAMYRRNK